MPAISEQTTDAGPSHRRSPNIEVSIVPTNFNASYSGIDSSAFCRLTSHCSTCCSEKSMALRIKLIRAIAFLALFDPLWF